MDSTVAKTVVSAVSQDIKIEVPLVSLRKALQQTKGTIATQDVNELLRNYLITGDAQSGTLTFLSTDLDLASVGTCQAVISADFKIAVPGIKLVQIAQSVKSDLLSFKLSGKSFTCSAGNYYCELQVMPADDFPTFPDLDTLTASQVSREVFLAHLRRISFSINNNVVKKNLLAVHISNGYIQASDGKVTSICACTLSGQMSALTIPALAVPDLITVLNAAEEPEIYISELAAFLIFKIGQSKFLARKSTAKFPDVLQLVLKPTENTKFCASFDRKEFREALQRVSITTDDKTYMVSIEFASDSLRLFSKDLAGNKGQEIVPAVWNGISPITYLFNYTYLLDIMGALISDNVKMLVPDNIRIPVRFEDQDFLCFLMRLVA